MKHLSQANFPRIGLRIIKSGIAIFICFLIDIFRGGSGIVFYSQLAALWCIRDYVYETKQFALQRTIGTVIGAVYGLLFIVLNQIVGRVTSVSSVSPEIAYGGMLSTIGRSLLISIVIVLVLYTTVLFGQKQASYFSCVVFLSIVINHVSDLNPYLFVWNRFLDTMIGICVGVCINCFSLHRIRNKDILFLSGIDDTLLKPGGEISAYCRVELNRMIENGVKFTVSTIRTPASLMEPLRGVNLSLPVIAMDGAALYNLTDNSYEKVYVIPEDLSVKIQEFFKQIGQTVFINVVVEDVLLIYYEDSDQVYYNQLIEKMRKSPYRNYLKRDGIVSKSAVYFMIIDHTEKIEKMALSLKQEPLFHNLRITVEKTADFADYSLLKIYNKNATKENMLDYLKRNLNVQKTVTFGTIPGRYTYTIEEGKFDQVVKYMKKEIGGAD